MNLSQYNNLIQPVTADKLWDRFFPDDNLIALGNGEYKYEGNLTVTHLGMSSLTEMPYNIVEVTGRFWCAYNNLTDLEGCPQKIGGTLACYDNKLTSLKGCAKKIGDSLVCDGNELTTLEGCPEEIHGDFWCHNNNLTSLEGAPKKVGGDFWAWSNAVKFDKDEIRAICDVGRNVNV